MTVPQQGNALVDTGNPMITPVPARMDTGTIELGGQKLGVLTIRTTSATVTVMLVASDVAAWAEILTGLAKQMSVGLVQATPVDMVALGQLDQQLRQRRGRRGQ